MTAGTIRLDRPGVDIAVRRHARARRLILRVTHGTNDVTLTIPARTPMRAAEEFAARQADWLARALAAHPPTAPVAWGLELPVEGRPVTLAAAPGPARIEGERLLLPGPEARLVGQLKGFLKALARDRIVAATDRYAAQLGLTVARVQLRDPRSRWGSCADSGALMFSWRLIMAPPPVLDYVAAHEVCHLRHMNHGAAYWKLVERICPDFDAQRDWLRRNGPGLHRLRLD